jgi:PAS domain S-box-containing protein
MIGTDCTTAFEISWDDHLSVFETVPDLYLVLSADQRVLTASNTYLEAISTSRDQVKLMSILAVFQLYGFTEPLGFQSIQESLDKAVYTARPQSMPVQRFSSLKRNQGEYPEAGYWQVSNTAVFDEHKNLLYIIHKINDITDIIEKEKQYQASLDEDLKKIAAASELLRKAEEAGNTGSYRLDLKTRKLQFSDGMYKLIGYEVNSFVPSLDFINTISHPDDVSVLEQAIGKAITTKKAYHYVRRVYSPQGDLKYILSRGRVVEDESGDPQYILGVSHDITRKTKQEEDLAKAHAALSQSKDLLQSIFDTSIIGMSLLRPIRDSDGKILDFTITLVSKELERETNRTDLIGKIYSHEYPGIRETALFDLMLKVMDTGVSENLEYYYPFEGFNKWYACTFVKMDDALVASNQDITPIRVAEAKIRHMEEDQKLEIFKVIISTQEEERNRISEDLRNGIGQLLSAVKMNLGQLDGSLMVTDPVGFLDTKRCTDQILADAIKEVRRLSHLMTPAILEDFGLEETVKDLCRQFSPMLEVKSNYSGDSRRLDRYLEVSLYRMAQELLQNVVSHANASKAMVELKYNEDDILLSVQDNGQRLAKQEIKSKSLGLATVYNKVWLLNGSVDVDLTNGTKVIIRIPIPAIV